MAKENNNVLFYNGYQFNWKSTNAKGIRFFECAKRVSERCKTRGKEDINGSFVITTDDHNHTLDKNPEEIRKFKNNLRLAVNTTVGKLKPIYDNVASRHSTASRYHPYVNVASNMRRWRRNSCPPQPKSLDSVSETLNSDRWKHLAEYKDGKITFKTFEVQDHGHVLVMADIDILKKLNCRRLLMDSTYDVCPRVPSKLQLLTIMGFIHGTYEPIAWALMNRKSQHAHELILKQFCEWAPQLSPNQFYTDFDQAEINAIYKYYPNVKVIRCYLHFLRASGRYLKSIKGKKQMEKLNSWSQGKNFFRKLQALPLLPADQIEAAFNWLCSQASPEIIQFFSEFLKYFERQWLTVVGVENLCVFGLDLRTTNPIEAYHGTLTMRIGHHPSIWEFIDKFVNRIVPIVRCEIEALEQLLPVRDPPKAQYQIHEKILTKAWDYFKEEKMDIPQFLSCSCHFLRTFNNQILFQTAEDVDHIFLFQVHNIDIQPQCRIMIDIEPEKERLQIFNKPMPGSEVDIFLFRELKQSLCPRCQREIVEYTSVPCNHWFACRNCMRTEREAALKTKENIYCKLCKETIIAFFKNYIS